MSQGQVTHKCVQPTRKWEFYWRQGWILMIMISPHQQYNLFILYSSSRSEISSGTSVWTLFDFFCPWDIIWWNIYWITNRIKKQMKWSIDSDLYQIMFLHFISTEKIFFLANKLYIFFVCPWDFLCPWDIWSDIYWMHWYQKANGIIHRSYQIMFLHFIFAKEILFPG